MSCLSVRTVLKMSGISIVSTRLFAWFSPWPSTFALIANGISLVQGSYISRSCRNSLEEVFVVSKDNLYRFNLIVFVLFISLRTSVVNFFNPVLYLGLLFVMSVLALCKAGFYIVEVNDSCQALGSSC